MDQFFADGLLSSAFSPHINVITGGWSFLDDKGSDSEESDSESESDFAPESSAEEEESEEVCFYLFKHRTYCFTFYYC